MSPTPEYLSGNLVPLDFFNENFDVRQKHIENLLCRYLNTGAVVAFIGAGASQPLGYPGWGVFARDIITILKYRLDYDHLPTKRPSLRAFLETVFQKEIYRQLLNTAITKRLGKVRKSRQQHKRKLLLAQIENDLGSADLAAFLKDTGFLNEDEIKSKKKEVIANRITLYKNVIETLDDKIAKEKNLQDDEQQASRNYVINKSLDKYNFDQYLEYLDQGQETELNALFIFSECERLLCKPDKWETDRQSSVFRLIVSSYFEVLQGRAKAQCRNKITDNMYNPYLALQELPIRKFITFNYDLEIERALLHGGKIERSAEAENKDIEDIYGPNITRESILEQFKKKSFSQKDENRDELARFSVARYDETDYSVFHCHGRIDDVESCVVSEEDYQKWYLREDVELYTPFRQTLNLALESNPILFMGFGLKDADLMRLLRQITANRPLNKTRTPLFCLLYVTKDDIRDEASDRSRSYYKWEDGKQLEAECTALYMKYGLHVIPVKETEWRKKKPAEKSDPMCEKLLELRDRWKDWWKGILLKPLFRKSPMKDRRGMTSYFHYEFELTGIIDTVDARLLNQLENILEPKEEDIKTTTPPGEPGAESKADTSDNIAASAADIAFASRLAVVIGDGGTGKSWAVQKYLEKHGRTYKNVFFWSAYYSNDVITGIDRLIEFFGLNEQNEAGPHKTKFQLLTDIIDNEVNKIIVFDGIEKLLIPNNENTEGASISPEVSEFFKIISHYKNKNSRIILTSRIFPTDVLYHFDSRLNREKEGDMIKALEDKKLNVRKNNVIIAPKCWTGDLWTKPEERVAGSPHKEVFELLRKDQVSSICSLVEGHVFGIALIRGILESYSERAGKKRGFSFEKAVGDLVQHIANTPVDRRIQSVIEKAVQNLDAAYPDKPVEKFVERIALFMHPIREEVAAVCFENLGFNAGVKPMDLLKELIRKNIVQQVKVKGRTGRFYEYVVHPLVRSYIFERLHNCLFVSLPSLQLPGFSSSKETVDPGDVRGKQCATELFNALCKKAEHLKGNVASDMCRAAFSVIRSRFCSNTVARWGSYDEYVKLVVKLYDTAKRVSPGHWDYQEPTDPGFKEFCESKTFAPLYPDELAWVYNEIGLASNSMGYILNCTALWEQGHEINKLIDRYEEGRYVFQSHFNLGAVNLYYGKLRVAQVHLDKAYEIANSLENRSLSNRVLGNTALLKYLQGNLEEADSDFTAACEDLESNPRARSFLYGLHGELAIKRGEMTKAADLLERSRHLAEAKYYPDLIAYARLGKANFLLHEEQYSDAQYEFQVALRVARTKSLFRLEAATLSGLSRLAEKLGDYQSARMRAIESLKIANEYSLGLHQTVSLLVLGKALVNSELREFGIAYLKTARELAKSQGYFLRLNEAEQELRKHNVLDENF